MPRILYAINQQEVEVELNKQLKNSMVCVGAVPYTEGVLPTLASTEADILLIRESLPGSDNFFSLIKTIRFECPNVRIICLLNEREDPHDLMLRNLVSLGVYDIINQNAISIADIISYIKEPRTFRDVANFYDEQYPDPNKPAEYTEPEETHDKKNSFLGGLFGKKDQKKPTQQKFITSTENSDQPDIEALRAAIQSDADRRARSQMNLILDDMVAKKTKELQEALDQSKQQITSMKTEKKKVDEQSFRAISELNAEKMKNTNLIQEIESLKKSTESRIGVYQTQLASLQSANVEPDAFAQRMQEWDALEKDYQGQITNLQQQVESLASGATSAPVAGPHMMGDQISSYDESYFVMPEDPSDFVEVSNASTHTYLFAGTKHGVGNTTAALNFATALAEKGYKTLYLEFNSHYPLINEYFEFLMVERGIDTAISGLKQGKKFAVESAIIKPHGIEPSKKSLAKTYGKLPGALHFMLFTNRYLQAEKAGQNEIFTHDDIDLFLAYLTHQLGYVYVVIDIQPDDPIGRILYRQCSRTIDQVVFTCTQDPHSISTLGLLINDLARSQSSDLAKRVKVLVNKFSTANDLTIFKIAKWMHLSQKRFYTLNDDQQGYWHAACNMLPYLISGGRNALEYRSLIQNI